MALLKKLFVINYINAPLSHRFLLGKCYKDGTYFFILVITCVLINPEWCHKGRILILMQTQLDVKITKQSSHIHGLHFLMEQKVAAFETLK